MRDNQLNCCAEYQSLNELAAQISDERVCVGPSLARTIYRGELGTTLPGTEPVSSNSKMAIQQGRGIATARKSEPVKTAAEEAIPKTRRASTTCEGPTLCPSLTGDIRVS